MKKFVYALAACLALCLTAGCEDDKETPPVSEVVTATLKQAGTLKTALGADINTVKYLAVVGPVDIIDMSVLREANITGNLSQVDLSRASFADNIFPSCQFAPPGLNSVSPKQNDSGFSKVDFELMILPDNLIKIDSAPFARSKVDVFVLPATLKELAFQAFAGDCEFKAIYIKATEPPVCLSDWTFDSAAERTLYVPAGCKDKYAAADQWKEFGKIVETDKFPTLK